MIGDIMGAVSYVLSLPEVDSKRIAVVGYSMGSFHAVLAAGLDPRISALVLSGGGDLDGNGGSWDSSSKIMCQGGPYQALSFLPDKGAILYGLHQRVGESSPGGERLCRDQRRTKDRRQDGGRHRVCRHFA